MQYYSQIYSMIFIDQLNNTIELVNYPKRIISLVPSQSELLWDLGLREELVGVTKFCIHPRQLLEVTTVIGGTKNLNIQKIRSLNPDLIIGNKEENDKEQITTLQKEFNVWMSDIYNLNDALNMIVMLGDVVNKQQASLKLKQRIQDSFLQLTTLNKTVLYLIWNNPYMAAGKNTFIDAMIQQMGLENSIKNDRYPQLNIEQIIHLNPDVIFLSSEPYPFKQLHIAELKQHVPNATILLVDGELFSWYGSRLTKSVTYFNTLLKLI